MRLEEASTAGTLLELVERGFSIRQIASEVGLSFPAIRYWLKKYGLKTEPLHYSSRDAEKTPSVLRECPTHGWTDYVRTGARGYYRCPVCTIERVASRRRRLKEILVVEAGGRCALCGYDAYTGALQFHHVDPRQKRFGLALGGLTGALADVRQEARKCVLLCGNCHAEVEAGLAEVALRRYSGVDRSGVAQWQSDRLLTDRLWVRVPPPELLE